MEQEEEIVNLKVFDEKKGDVVFEGKVSTDVEPADLVKLKCFWERNLYGIYNKATNEEMKSFKGLQNNVELVARDFGIKDFKGVLFVGADDGVVRKSERVPTCACVLMSVWRLSLEECEKAFKCETLEDLEVYNCKLRQIPREIGRMKKLKKLRLSGLDELKNIPEEIGELLSLEELWIEYCGVESLSKRLKHLNLLKSISLWSLYDLQLNAEDLVSFSRLKDLKIWNCGKVFTPSFEQSFWEMIKSTTDIRVLDLDWDEHKQETVAAALEENGSIVDGGWSSESYARFFKRNKENHERAMECVVRMLAIRRWRNALNGVPKEMVTMIAMMLWNTKCDVETWSKKSESKRKRKKR